MKKLFFLVLFFLNYLSAEPRLNFEQTALDKYVHSIDESFNYEIVKTISSEGVTTHIVDLTSQTFLTKKEINRTKWKLSLIHI